MKLSELSKTTTKTKRRLGQGHGSGRVKTSGRGTKGQKARNKVPSYFEGGALPLIKRMPFRRGKGKNKTFAKKPIAINVKVLNLFDKGAIVTVESLIKQKIVDGADAKLYGIKILGDGDLGKALTVKVLTSKGAKSKIEKAGGRVELDEKK
ncbi:MAG TPA: 50S ribosomal protein L15 [Candidatus Saccharimonadales bacterium]|nr:50S ribosomal protein L15 [Candidatus Saccharimonadales bacterium]